MYWYVFDTKPNSTTELLGFLNRQANIEAFIPRVEKYFKCSGFEGFQLKDMYPGYIFIKTSLNESEFKNEYFDFLKTVKRLGKILEKDEFIALSNDEIDTLSRLFDESNLIRHSCGKYNGNELVIYEGPLKGFEKNVKKINRHKKIAEVGFEFLGKEMMLPLEVINKKGSALYDTR